MAVRTSRVPKCYSKEDTKLKFYLSVCNVTDARIMFSFPVGFACQILKKEITIGLSTKMALNWAKKAIV